MSLLRLDLQAVEAAKSQVNQGRLKLSQLDGRLPTVEYAIGARRGIQGRMNQAARRMRELEHKVQELSSFIHRAQGQYSEVESALTAMAQALQHHRSLNAGQGEQTVGNAETRPKQGAHHVTILSSIMEWLASNKDKPQQMNTTAMRAGMLGGDSSTPGLQDGYFPFNPFRPFDFSTYQRSDQDLYGQINGCPAPSDAMQFYMQVEQAIQDVKWKVVEGVGSFVQGGIDAFVGTYDGVMDIAKNIKEGNFEDLPSFLTNNPEKQREEAQAFIDEINERVINGDANSRFNYAGGVVIPSLLAAGLGRTLMQVLKKAPDVPKLPKKEPIPSKVDVEKPKVQEPLKPDRDKPVGTEGTVNAGRQTVKSNLGKELDITPSAKHTITEKNPGYKGEPNTSVDILDSKGEVTTRRWFGPDGKATRDVDFDQHGNPKEHPEAPHEHTWTYGEDGKPTGRPPVK